MDPVVGRDQELSLSRTFVEGLRDGPRALLLEGEAGIGKTAVWRAALAEAEAAGCRVLRCVAVQAEARLSLVGLGDLAGELADELLPALPGPQREALEVALVRRAGGSGRAPDPATVGVGFRSLLAAAAQAGPVVVAVDDLQWLDTETARVLAFAMRRLDGHPVGVLATMRTPLAVPDPLGLERALGSERFVRARLGPLRPEELRVLIESRLGYEYRRPTLLRIVQASAGNALFALELSLGDAAAAWAVLAPGTEALEANGTGEPLAMFVPHALEALIALGELDRAERLLDDFDRKASELGRVAAVAASARCRALLLAARGDLRGAHEAIEHALAEHARTDMPFEHARSLLVQGQLHRRRRQKRATRESLEQALALFEPMGAELWAQRARDELARLGRRRREGLTASEGRVTDLAVQGLSNKEIAQALFVTVHTVEVHLSHAYAKLGVRSRTQLAGRLAAVEV